MNLSEAKKTPFAWPGGYPIYAILDDGESVCHACLATEDEIHEGGDADGWRYEGAGIYWEGPDMACAHCDAPLPSAYGDPDGARIDALVKLDPDEPESRWWHMDPDATLAEIIDALTTNDPRTLTARLDTAEEALRNLSRWLASEGFTPLDPRHPSNLLPSK